MDLCWQNKQLLQASEKVVGGHATTQPTRHQCKSFILPAGVVQAAHGADVLLYGQDAAGASGGLMESSYRNVQEACVALQAVYPLLMAGEDVGAMDSLVVAVTSIWQILRGCFV